MASSKNILKIGLILATILQLSSAIKLPMTIDEAIARDEEEDPVDVPNVVGLDEKFTPAQLAEMKNPSRTKRSAGSTPLLVTPWANGVIKYRIDPGFSQKQRATILSAMAEWRSYTCLKFVPGTSSDRHMISVKKDGGCWSWIGVIDKRQQEFSLGKNCVFKGIVVHELGHTMGFIHEQTRPDRDRYVQILWQNIDRAQKSNFEKVSSRMDLTYGKPYDFTSVMHYGKYEMSVDGDPTIKPLPQYRRFADVIGNRYGVSYFDVQAANAAYKCASKCGAISCPDGFVGPDCRCWCQGSSLKVPVVFCDTKLPVTQTRVGAVPKAKNPDVFPAVAAKKLLECKDLWPICPWLKTQIQCKYNDLLSEICRVSCNKC